MSLNWKGKHEVLFQVKIGLAGLTVKSKATELNSKARTTESKKFPCQVQSWGVRSPHCRPRCALYCTYWSSKLQLTRANSTSTRLVDLPHLLLRKQKKMPRLAFSCYGHLNSRKPHTTPHICERTTFTKIINKKMK